MLVFHMHVLTCAGREFMSGASKPGLADLALYGALRSMEGLDTLTDVIANTRIQLWYERMTAAVGPTSGTYAERTA